MSGSGAYQSCFQYVPAMEERGQLRWIVGFVDLSPSLQEHLENNFDRHRYPTRFSLSKKSYSMACTSKYSYAASHLAHTPAHPIHFHDTTLFRSCLIVRSPQEYNLLPPTVMRTQYFFVFQGSNVHDKAAIGDFLVCWYFSGVHEKDCTVASWHSVFYPLCSASKIIC